MLLISSPPEAPLPSQRAGMPARLSLLSCSHLQIGAFQGEEMKIKSPGDVFLGGLETGSRLELRPARRGCWIRASLLVWTESSAHPAHRFAIARGKQGSRWDSAGLGCFSQLGLFLYGYPQYCCLFWDVFYLKKNKQTKKNKPEHLDSEKAHSPE